MTLSRKAQLVGAARRARQREIEELEREAEHLATVIKQVHRRIAWHKRLQDIRSRVQRT